MQIRALRINGLFGRVDHELSFPVTEDSDSATPSLLILHGPNGIGKTTALRMLDGMMRLDFNPIREVPVDAVELEFTTGQILRAERAVVSRHQAIRVAFDSNEAVLHSQHSGGLRDTDAQSVNDFRDAFDAATRGIQFEFIDIERLHRLQPEPPGVELDPMVVYARAAGRPRQARRSVKAPRDERGPLAAKVFRFVRDAQVDHRFYFASTEPSLVTRLIDGLENDAQTVPRLSDVRKSLAKLEDTGERLARFGLGPDRLDYEQLTSFANKVARWRGDKKQRALTVIGAYVEVLESRASERELVGERLSTFERLMADFLSDKSVTIDPEAGLRIEDSSGLRLREYDLSSGEFHLLYLMVSALVTRRRGTVVAIDEPEMSMHIAWQRRLVPALYECASRAAPLFILATHSPEIAAPFPEALVDMAASSR